MTDDGSSIDEVGAASCGLSGMINHWDNDKENEFKQAMLGIASDIAEMSDGFFGHIKAILTSDDKSMSMNLVEPSLGVSVHGEIPDGSCAFRIIVAALDVDSEYLRKAMNKRLSGIEGLKVESRRSGLILPS
jgi:hypothetical protein